MVTPNDFIRIDGRRLINTWRRSNDVDYMCVFMDIKKEAAKKIIGHSPGLSVVFLMRLPHPKGGCDRIHIISKPILAQMIPNVCALAVTAQSNHQNSFHFLTPNPYCSVIRSTFTFPENITNSIKIFMRGVERMFRVGSMLTIAPA